MAGGQAWQCGDCHTMIDGPDTRKCPNCGGINFYPVADEVPGDGNGAERTTVATEGALERLGSDEPS